MGDEVGESSQSQIHMSADDLNDGFILDTDDKKTLSYQVRGDAIRRACVIKNGFVSGIFLSGFVDSCVDTECV